MVISSGWVKMLTDGVFKTTVTDFLTLVSRLI